MSLYERYELLDLNRDIGVKTFEAREIATGRPVKVHLFVHPSAPLQAALLKALDKVPEEHRRRIIEQGKHEGTPYVVTDRLIDYPGLNEWVQAVVQSTKPAKAVLETAGAWKVPPVSSPAPSPSAPVASEPAPLSASTLTPASPPDVQTELNQKFTELFTAVEQPVPDNFVSGPRDAALAPAPQTVSDSKPAAVRPAAQVRSEPGEFTRMFQSPAAPLSAPQGTSAPTRLAAPAPPSSPAQKEAGEFTRMFQSPAGYGATPKPAAPASSAGSEAAKPGPGEFTRFFEAPSPSGPMPQSAAVQQPLAPLAAGRSPFNPVSEFTRAFGKPGTEAPPPPPVAASQQEPGEFTRMFPSPAGPAVARSTPVVPRPQSPSSSPAAQALPPATGAAAHGYSAPAASPAAPKSTGPGDYTRQFSAPAQLTFGQSSLSPETPVAVSSGQAYAPPAMAQAAMPHMNAPTPTRKSNLPLILGIVGIVLVAALLIVFFAMRPK